MTVLLPLRIGTGLQESQGVLARFVETVPPARLMPNREGAEKTVSVTAKCSREEAA